jgi:hypothetical protein
MYFGTLLPFDDFEGFVLHDIAIPIPINAGTVYPERFF